MTGRVRDAATVALVRPGARGVEVYLLQRVTTMAFAAGMHVFPGGRVDAADGDDVPWLTSVTDHELAERLGTAPSDARALVVAAVRETFEESGVLIVRHRTGAALVPDSTQWESFRLAVLARETGFGQALRDLEAVIDPALLHVWDHWITPQVEPRRYDTRFFVAALPPGQETVVVGGEAESVLWIDPVDAVARYRSEGFALMPPTLAVLSSLQPFTTVADVLDSAGERVIRPLLPTAVETDGAVRWELRDAETGALVAPGDGTPQ